MKRVGILHASYSPLGGAEYLSLYHAQALKAQGAAVKVVTQRLPEHLDLWPDIPFERFQKYTLAVLLMSWNRTAKLRARARALTPHLADRDLVIAHNAPMHVLLAHAAYEGERAWFCHEPSRSLFPEETTPWTMAALQRGQGDVDARLWQDLESACRRWRNRAHVGGTRVEELQAQDRWAAGRMHRVLANSSYTAGHLRRIYGRDQVHVVPPTVRFPEQVAPRQGRSGGLKVLAHARLDLLKNLDTVIQGFARYRDRLDPEAELHIVGEGRRREVLEAEVQEVGARGIHFHGFLSREALEGLYAHCDVLALLPLDEPFGMVFVEAATRGLLLVGPDHGGPVEITEGGSLGWLQDSLEPRRLAETLAEVAACPGAEMDRRRRILDDSCRARFGPSTVGSALAAGLGL